MRIAIIGSGISGLVAAHELHPRHDITLYEGDARLGGHTHTVDVTLDDGTYAVDTGFIVYNERNYPQFTRLLRRWGVATQESDMSFSLADERTGHEWTGSLHGVLTSPAHWRMFGDIVRFNRAARRHLAEGDDDVTVGEFLAAGGWGRALAEEYLLPLGAAVWSADPDTFGLFPARALFRFLDNHGLLHLWGQPRWRTVAGGSHRYVEAVTAPFADRIRLATPVRGVVRHFDAVEIHTDGGVEEHDHVVIASHSDQALDLLVDATPEEKEVLGRITYQPNEATLHTDRRLLPRNPRKWASWNALRRTRATGRVAVTYHMNRLQRLGSRHQICVSLNCDDLIDPATVVARFRYSHPVFDGDALAAQRRWTEISGTHRTSYAGAYWGYGFHEDGVVSALRAVARIDP